MFHFGFWRPPRAWESFVLSLPHPPGLAKAPIYGRNKWILNSQFAAMSLHFTVFLDQNCFAFSVSPALYAEWLSTLVIYAGLFTSSQGQYSNNKLLRGSTQLSLSNLFMLSPSNLARHINELTLYIQWDIRYWTNNLKSCIVYGINLRKPYLCLPQWSSPSEATESFISKEIWLAPPQFYEIRRLENFASLSELHKFCLDHVLKGVERWMPIVLLTADGQISLLPGKISEASIL